MQGRLERQRRVLARMVGYYCRRKHGSPAPCRECASLLDYAAERLARCRHGEAKPACSRCGTPCYRSGERERIRRVMRFSGPRMLVVMPLEFLAHAFAASIAMPRAPRRRL